MEREALWIVAVIGGATLAGVFLRMKGGFGPINLRIVGIVLIASLASLLAIAKADSLTAAMGLLGAIAGYLFGTKSKESPSETFTGVSADSSRFGDNARLAGRDINETVHKIERMLGDMQGISQATVESLQVLSAEANTPKLMRRVTDSLRWESDDPNFVASLEALAGSRADGWTQQWIDRCLAQPECIAAIRSAVAVRSDNDWTPHEIDFDNHGDGIHVNIRYQREVKLPPP